MKYDRKNMAIPWNAFWSQSSEEKQKTCWSALTGGGKQCRHAFAAALGLAPLDGVNLLQNSLLRGSQRAIRRKRERRVLHISDGQSGFERLEHHLGFCLHSRDRRGPTRKVPTICVCSGFDSQRDWPGPALLHAHVTPSAPRYINNTFNKDNRCTLKGPEFLFDIMERALLDTTCRCWLIIHKTQHLTHLIHHKISKDTILHW